MKKAKISILIPVHNVSKYLDKCLESVVNQTMKDIEIICIDDKSTDNSLDIIKKYAKTDDRIKLIEKEVNKGYGNSMNLGLTVATGEYIGIVESDDWIDLEMFEKLWKLTNNGTVDLVKANFYDCYEKEDFTFTKYLNTEKYNIAKESEVFDVRHKPAILFGHPSIWSCIYKKSMLDKHHICFIEEKGGGWVDNPFFFETIFVAKSIVWTDEGLYYYRKTNPNSSSNNQLDLTLPIRRMIDNITVMRKYEMLDLDIQKYMYARVFQYIGGVIYDKNYIKQEKIVRKYISELLKMVNKSVIDEHFNDYDKYLYYHYITPIDSLAEKRKKILIYNWVPFDNPHKVGGGVTVYCNNLIRTFIENRSEYDIYFLSSGWAYDNTTTEPYINRVGSIYNDRVKKFEVVNSPVPAPQNMVINSPDVYLENEKLKGIIRKFLDDYGLFDVIHFNNIEGLSLDVLSLKIEYPNSRFIFSLHNYIPLCITGFYFNRKKLENCTCKKESEECKRCLLSMKRQHVSNELYERAKNGPKSKTKVILEDIWNAKMNFYRFDTMCDSSSIDEYYNAMRNCINKYIDKILAVSERVKEIAIENGLDESKIETSYIGTAIADFQYRGNIAKNSKYFTIGYLGSDYNVVEKGFQFLIDSLAQLDEKIKRNINLILTTTTCDAEQKMRNKLTGFNDVKIKIGYSHNEIKGLLQSCDLCIMPTIWEDNLPQISLEMTSVGIPVLTSDSGGTKEIVCNERFIFKKNDTKDFIEHLVSIMENKEWLEDYWNNCKKLTTMQDHLCEIESIYEIHSSNNDIVLSKADYDLLIQENMFLNSLAEKAINGSIHSNSRGLLSKLKNLKLCYINNGFVYTFKRGLFHLRNAFL